MKRKPPPRQQSAKSIRDRGTKPITKSELLIKPKEIKLKKVKLSIPDEASIEKENLIEKKVVKDFSEEKQVEFIPPEPQISNCPFCGLEINEDVIFCPQCGKKFKK